VQGNCTDEPPPSLTQQLALPSLLPFKQGQCLLVVAQDAFEIQVPFPAAVPKHVQSALFCHAVLAAIAKQCIDWLIECMATDSMVATSSTLHGRNRSWMLHTEQSGHLLPPTSHHHRFTLSVRKKKPDSLAAVWHRNAEQLLSTA
jgi:hypothetical protein